MVENERLWELFHRKWTRDVGTEGYNKKEWVELETEILAIIAKKNKDNTMGPLEDIREASIDKSCSELAWLLANTWLSHLRESGNFNEAYWALRDTMRDAILEHSLPPKKK
jgi:hypothetical protein